MAKSNRQLTTVQLCGCSSRQFCKRSFQTLCWIATSRWLTNTRGSWVLKFKVLQVPSVKWLVVFLHLPLFSQVRAGQKLHHHRQFCWTVRWREFHYDLVNRLGVRAIWEGTKSWWLRRLGRLSWRPLIVSAMLVGCSFTFIFYSPASVFKLGPHRRRNWAVRDLCVDLW